MEKLISFIKDWNTHSKHALIAQIILSFILQHPIQVLQSIDQSHWESLSVYSEKHLAHCNTLIKDSYLLDYTLERMEALF